MDRIDDYIELLYEELPDKIKGTFLILKLTQVPEYLPAILANGILYPLPRIIQSIFFKCRGPFECY